ncbi:MAG: hypothetical protein V4543_00180 [Bacteroidota bacterium]
MKKISRILCCLIILLTAFSGAVTAQNNPARPIKKKFSWLDVIKQDTNQVYAVRTKYNRVINGHVLDRTEEELLMNTEEGMTLVPLTDIYTVRLIPSIPGKGLSQGYRNDYAMIYTHTAVNMAKGEKAFTQYGGLMSEFSAGLTDKVQLNISTIPALLLTPSITVNPQVSMPMGDGFFAAVSLTASAIPIIGKNWGESAGYNTYGGGKVAFTYAGNRGAVNASLGLLGQIDEHNSASWVTASGRLNFTPRSSGLLEYQFGSKDNFENGKVVSFVLRHSSSVASRMDVGFCFGSFHRKERDTETGDYISQFHFFFLPVLHYSYNFR